TGHAVEARICAEDPARDFLPTGGTVLALHEVNGAWDSPLPEKGRGTGTVRTDSGLSPGAEVGSRYDPMLSKVIAHGPDRATALRTLRAALAATVTLGVTTNAGFLRRLLAHPDVVSGDLDTGLVERAAAGLVDGTVPDEVYAAAGAVRQAALEPAVPEGGWRDPFAAPTGFRLGGEPAPVRHWLRVPGHDPVAYDVRPGAPENVREVTADRVRITVDGVLHTFHRSGDWLGRDGDSWHVTPYDPVAEALRGAAGAHGADTLAAPMPGTVTVVKVAVGDDVVAGQGLLVVEAMKMEHVISAPHAGTVTELDVTAGATVAMDQVLAVVAPHESATDAKDAGDASPGTDEEDAS
ncbi:biotin/lipoyl-containing protein, partial [Streptomyces sp. CT34]|uniref:biotin/lipoyl-containing protein n=1 Tax=Streptomyces sp. CT34 TaxID=1553907 RepID=UPI00321F6AE2